MSVNDEEPYSTIFASLKHPIRRRILRMLSEKPMSFSEMLEVLGVSSSFLTYHLENLGELIGKIDDGKYRLSSFGEAAMATMTKVEDIPTSTSTKPRRMVGKTVAIALGLVCIILVVGLIGTFAYYAPMISDKNNMISSLDAQISKLNSNVTNLQKQITSDNATINSLISNATMLQGELNSILNGSKSLLDIITSDPSAWVNKTVEVEGTLGFPFPPSLNSPVPDVVLEPWLNLSKPTFPPEIELSSLGAAIGVYFAASYNNSSYVYSGENVTVRGVVTRIWTGETGRGYANGTLSWQPVFFYFIGAESIEPL